MAPHWQTDASVGAQSRRPDIQGLRAVAVGLVVLYHARAKTPGGFVGVDVFFVISGYVITRMLAAEFRRTKRIDLRRFYLRRIRRLLPALGLLLAMALLASILLGTLNGQPATAGTGAAAAVFSANLYLIGFGGDGGYFAVESEMNALLHTWSLSVEEQFYLVFPALLVGAWSFGHRRTRVSVDRVIGAALGLITVVSFGLSWLLSTGRLLTDDGLAGRLAFYSAPTRAWEFAVGGLLALFGARLAGIGRVIATVMSLGGLVVIAYAAWSFDEQTIFPGTAALLPVAGALLVIAAGEGQAVGFPSKLLAIRPAQFFGDLSYSWYLWHWPVIVFAAALWPRDRPVLVAAALVSLVPAWLSLRLVENPIRFAPSPLARRTVALALACVLVPLACGLVLGRANSTIRSTARVADFEAQLGPHIDVVSGCNSEVPLGQRDTGDCTWLAPDGARSAVLIGDSNAGHFSEAFIDAAGVSGIDATIATFSACPFIDLIMVRNGIENSECGSFVAESLSALEDDPPDFLFVGSCSICYLTSPEFVFMQPRTGKMWSTPEGRAQAWEDALSSTLGGLVDVGIDIVVLHVTPSPGSFDHRECAAFRVLNDEDACGVSVSRDTAETARSRAVHAEIEAVRRANAQGIDVADALCTERVCAASRDGRWFWRDVRHITIGASASLSPFLQAVMQS